MNYYASTFDNQCLLTFIIAIVIIILFFWFLYPAFTYPANEGFQGYVDRSQGDQFVFYPPNEGGPVTEPEKMTNSSLELRQHDPPSEQPAYFNAETGTIMDGTNFKYPQMEAPYDKREYNGLDYMDLEKMQNPNFQDIYTKGDDKNMYLLDDGSNGQLGFNYAACSPSCCSAQYPTPFKLKYDPLICKNKSNYVASNLTCQNQWQDTGCFCLTKKQSEFLANRGQYS